MADEISPRRHQYVEHWPDWPSSAPAAHGRQHHCAAGPIRPVPDKYSLATDERRNGQTNKQKDMAAAAGGGLYRAFVDMHSSGSLLLELIM